MRPRPGNPAEPVFFRLTYRGRKEAEVEKSIDEAFERQQEVLEARRARRDALFAAAAARDKKSRGVEYKSSSKPASKGAAPKAATRAPAKRQVSWVGLVGRYG